MKVNRNPVERIYPDDKRVKSQTIAHHKARYKFAAAIFSKKGEWALDLACGTGYGSEILRQAGYRVLGVDNSETAIDYALAHYPLNDYFNLDITKMKFAKVYSLIVLFEALEHLTKKDGIELLKRISKALMPKGIFIMSVPRDINRKNNGFHLSEWNYHDLDNQLVKIFGTVEILGQDWDTAKITAKDAKHNDFYICLCKND